MGKKEDKKKTVKTAVTRRPLCPGGHGYIRGNCPNCNPEAFTKGMTTG